MLVHVAMLNRSAVVVGPKQPFLDWLRALPNPVDEELTLDALKVDRTVYLVPEWDTPEQFNAVLRECFDVIFEAELAGWWTEPSDWPSRRTFAIFKQWFDVESHSVIEDLCEGLLIDDEV